MGYRKRFYITRHNFIGVGGVTINGWRVRDHIGEKVAKGTKGDGGPAGYEHRRDAQSVCDNLNRAWEEVQKEKGK